MRDELLNETLFMSIAHAREAVAAWAADYNTARPHSSLATPLRPHTRSDFDWPQPSDTARLSRQAAAGRSLTGAVPVNRYIIAGTRPIISKP